MHKVSVVITTLNEAATIELLLVALKKQTVKPWEIVVCDGGSTDSTWELLHKFKKNHPSLRLVLIQEQGNISRGRNTAITHSKGTLLALTDAGCIPEKNWLEELLRVYDTSSSPVIAGFYRGLPRTPFQQAVVPYVLIMPDALSEAEFLPATRSMLMEKEIWKKYGGFDESLEVSEDYAFAKKLQANAVPISMARKAVVGWMPRKNVSEFFLMLQKFARYDIVAGILRPKVVLLFLRYVVALLLLLGFVITQNQTLFVIIVLAGIFYCMWAISKHLKYVPHGWYWLPVLQFSADFAVMSGTVKGFQYKQKEKLK